MRSFNPVTGAMNAKTDELYTKYGLHKVEERMESLFVKYLTKAIYNKNELILKLCDEYKQGFDSQKKANKMTKDTLLCKHIKVYEELIII